jgi:hypothetical protein
VACPVLIAVADERGEQPSQLLAQADEVVEQFPPDGGDAALGNAVDGLQDQPGHDAQAPVAKALRRVLALPQGLDGLGLYGQCLPVSREEDAEALHIPRIRQDRLPDARGDPLIQEIGQ